jgi:hypothetical protein
MTCATNEVGRDLHDSLREQAWRSNTRGRGDGRGENRLVWIHPDRVVFERDGHAFFVRVGPERLKAPTSTPTTPYVRKGVVPLTVVAPPETIEEIRQQTGTSVDLLKVNPEFQKSLDERLRRVRERGGALQ